MLPICASLRHSQLAIPPPEMTGRLGCMHNRLGPACDPVPSISFHPHLPSLPISRARRKYAKNYAISLDAVAKNGANCSRIIRMTHPSFPWAKASAAYSTAARETLLSLDPSLEGAIFGVSTRCHGNGYSAIKRVRCGPYTLHSGSALACSEARRCSGCTKTLLILHPACRRGKVPPHIVMVTRVTRRTAFQEPAQLCVCYGFPQLCAYCRQYFLIDTKPRAQTPPS